MAARTFSPRAIPTEKPQFQITERCCSAFGPKVEA